MSMNIPKTQHVEIKTFDNKKIPKRPMMDHIEVHKPKDVLKDVDDLLSTEAGQQALKMCDMEVDGKQCISAAKWNAYVAEKFPHVTANPVKNFIEPIDAMKSLETYAVKEQAAQKAAEKAALAEKSEQEGGDGKAPEMGV